MEATTGVEVLPELQALDMGDLRSPSQPAKIYVHEALTLHHRAQADREALEGAALDWRYVTAIPVLARSLRLSQSRWVMLRRTQEDAVRRWKEEEPGAYRMRDDILANFRYAYRKRSDLLARVADISKGTGGVDLVQDLKDVEVLGREHPEPLTAIKFDLTRLDAAAAKADELGDVLAIRDADVNADPLKKKRDRAFTLLKQAVDEIRGCGRFVFRNDPAILAHHSSAYARRVRSAGGGDDEATRYQPGDGAAFAGEVSGNGQAAMNAQVPPVA